MESTLSVTRDDLLREVGRFLGWGRNPNTWDDRAKADGDDIVSRGLRQFYSPPILPQEATAHSWSCLKPIASMATVANQPDYDLPDDFGGMDSPLCYSGSDIGFGEIHKCSDQQVLELRQAQNTLTGFPRKYAISPLPSNGDEPTRYSLLLYPTPQSVYDLKFRYQSNPLNITGSRPFPLGGQPLAQALVSSVIAAADELINDNYRGPTWVTYLDHLRSAVSHDRQQMGPKNLGYNSDPNMDSQWLPRRALAITYSDQSYGHEGYFFSE